MCCSKLILKVQNPFEDSIAFFVAACQGQTQDRARNRSGFVHVFSFCARFDRLHWLGVPKDKGEAPVSQSTANKTAHVHVVGPLYLSTGRPTTLCETMGKAEIWLIRTYWDFEFPRPFLPNFEFVGGLHCQPAKPLPKVSRLGSAIGWVSAQLNKNCFSLWSSLVQAVAQESWFLKKVLCCRCGAQSYLAICPALCKLRASFTACTLKKWELTSPEPNVVFILGKRGAVS